MTHDLEEFDHTVEAWTVGDLKRALADVPDELPIVAEVAETPGGDTADDQVVLGAKLGEQWIRASRRMQPAFVIDLEYPSGQYYRPRSH